MKLNLDIPDYSKRVYRSKVLDGLVDSKYKIIEKYIEDNLLPGMDFQEVAYAGMVQLSKSLNLYSGLTYDEIQNNIQLSKDMKYWVQVDDGTYWFRSHEAEDWRFTIPIVENPVRNLFYNGVVCQYIKFKDVSGFRKSGLDYITNMNKGYRNKQAYCPLRGKAYRDFWDKETDRCSNGFDTDSLHIPGRFYFYMNYGVVHTPSIDVKTGKLSMKNRDNKMSKPRFPRFSDHLYYFALEIEAAYGEGYNNPEDVFGFVLLKSRRLGITYAFVNMVLIYNYTFITESASQIITKQKPALIASTNAMVAVRNHLNNNTEFAQHKLPGTGPGVLQAGRKVGDTVTGSMSRIVQIAIDKDFQKSVGDRSTGVLYEESGTNDKLVETITSAQPLCYAGITRIAPDFAFGTGGDMNKGSKSFFKLFYNPKGNNFKAYANIYDNKNSSQVGLFYDCNWYSIGEYEGHSLFDEHGNSWRMLTSIYYDTRIKDWMMDEKTMNNIAYYPKKPLHAFLQDDNNLFNPLRIAERQEELIQRYNNGEFDDKIGRFERDPGDLNSWRFVKKARKTYISVYPINKDMNKKGSILMMEPPSPHDMIKTGYVRYIMYSDMYDQDYSKTSKSLGSTFVFDRLLKKLVCEYTSREPLPDYYDQVAQIAITYNAMISFDNNTLGLDTAMIERGLVDRLTLVPQLIANTTQSQRKYGMPTTAGTKELGLGLYKTFLEKEHELYGEDGYSSIDSLPLLDEMGYYGTFNTDRMSTILHIFLLDYNYHLLSEAKEKNSSVSTLLKGLKYTNNDDEDDAFFDFDEFSNRYLDIAGELDPEFEKLVYG